MVGITNSSDYSPFGVTLDGRTVSRDSYRYGYQGSEKDDEAKESGNSYTTLYRQQDPRVGRFFAVDPLASGYPYNSSYAFSENRVIDGFELEGLEFCKYWSRRAMERSLKKLKDDPISINQVGAGTCAIAAVTYLWIEKNPGQFDWAVHQLYFKGEVKVASFEIKPDKKLFWVSPFHSRISTKGRSSKGDKATTYDEQNEFSVDWMILSSIQNSLHPEDDFYGYSHGSNSNAGNTTRDIEYLMKNLLGYNKVFSTSYSSPNDVNPESVLNHLEANLKNGYDVIIAINAKILPNGSDGGHAVTYLGGLEKKDGKYSFNVQSWGKEIKVSVTEQEFKDNYIGSVNGKQE